MAIYCKKCQIYFSEDCLKYRYYDDKDTGFQRIEKVCPICGRGHLQRAENCVRCGGFFNGKNSVCHNCAKELKAELEAFLEKYSVEEQEVMLSW